MSMKYKVMTSSSAEGLTELVQEKLDEGWELYGNPYSGAPGTALYHCQAVIKPEQSPALRGMPIRC